MKLKLLTLGNPKTAKGVAKNYLTAILHLAPYNLSGVNVCPMAEVAGCVKSCLNTAGHGGIGKGGMVTYSSVKHHKRTNRVQQCRIRRTRLFLTDRNEFMAQLAADIRKVVTRAEKLGLKPAIRLNGTSDIRWEDIPYHTAPPGSNSHSFGSIFQRFPDVQFYDYTKLPNRKRALDVTNYHLTFSYSNRPEFRKFVEKAIENYGDKVNIAVVFAKGASAADLPELLRGRPIVNGDENDLRLLDPSGVIIALKAKGNGRKDKSGFVVQPEKV